MKLKFTKNGETKSIDIENFTKLNKLIYNIENNSTLASTNIYSIKTHHKDPYNYTWTANERTIYISALTLKSICEDAFGYNHNSYSWITKDLPQNEVSLSNGHKITKFYVEYRIGGGGNEQASSTWWEVKIYLKTDVKDFYWDSGKKTNANWYYLKDFSYSENVTHSETRYREYDTYNNLTWGDLIK